MVWMIFGFVGQAVFSLRFIVQWIVSEKEKKSIIPVFFWYLSIAGSLILLIYSIHQKDPVFILGQLTGSVIYVRNLVLIWKEKKK
jgi:lipid-A-disaccharide synthase-like uncharacterized protein